MLRVGFAVDVLNLIAIVRARQPTRFTAIREPGNNWVMGYSMGGGVALRVITVDPNIQVVVFIMQRYFVEGVQGFAIKG